MALDNYRNDMLRCTRCSCCKYIPLLSILKSKRFAYNCPAVSRYNFHAYSGSGKLISALSLLEGRIDYTDRLLDAGFEHRMHGAAGHGVEHRRRKATVHTAQRIEVALVGLGTEVHGACFDDIHRHRDGFADGRAREITVRHGLQQLQAGLGGPPVPRTRFPGPWQGLLPSSGQVLSGNGQTLRRR